MRMLTTQAKQNFDEIPEVVVSFISAKIGAVSGAVLVAATSFA